MGITDGVPVGDWLRGLELLLWLGVVGLDVAGLSHAHSPKPHPSTEINAKTQTKGRKIR